MSHDILIIEDEVVLAKNMRLYLERAGYDVRVSESAEDGFSQIRQCRPDLIVLDYQLPGRNGLEVMATLGKQDPGIKVIMLTGQASVDLAVEAMKLGATDFLSKPVVLGKLKEAIEKILDTAPATKTLPYDRERPGGNSGLDQLIGESPEIERLKSLTRRLLEAEAALGDDEPPAVLIAGETGSGKEVLARGIHDDGPRKSGPFIELNCGSIPAQLLEAELFGHERGAFTDAKERKIGLVEAADGGTLFLDEIGDMDPALQVKLLKLLEEKTVRRLGSVRDQKVNVRIIAATHQPLEQRVSEGRFRADLFFRLRIVQLTLPPLRDRGSDILLLASHFLRRQCNRYGKALLRFSPAAERAMLAYSWPGNVRELRNVIEQTVLLATDAVIEPAHLPFCSVLNQSQGTPPQATNPPAVPAVSLETMERQMLEQALEKTAWNVTHAARILGISRDTLRYRIDKHGLSRSETSSN